MAHERLAALAGFSLMLLTACQMRNAGNARHGLSSPDSITDLSALRRGEKMEKLSYAGKWEFVQHRKDGRYAGASARSHTPGSSMTVLFVGDRLRIFGVTGPNGGQGLVVLPNLESKIVSFWSRSKRTHQLLYDSGTLGGDVQSASVVVVQAHNARAGYVNIEEVQISGGGPK